MTFEKLVSLLKIKIGISSTVMDERLQHLLQSIIDELKDHLGITVDLENYIHTEFVLDYAHYRYRFPTEPMPQHLKLRRNNLYLKDSQS